jgi:hypothetical protein
MKSKIKTVWIVLFTVTLFLAIPVPNWAGGNKQEQQNNVKPQTQQKATLKPTETPQPKQPVSPFWTGDGGKGSSITILAPRVSGLSENQNYLPNLVQGELVSNFSNYSAIAVLDRVRLDEQYAELLSGYYDDNAQAGSDLGHLLPTDFIMGGNITRTSSGFALQLWVTKSADKTTAASYSGACSFGELDNLSGVRRASLDLLQKLGITPTSQTKTELAGAATVNHVNAQTALARGITAQKSGTEVAALSYYYQAAAFDSSFLEAAGRAQVMNADISSGNIGNIGENVRNDIAWRRAWVERLSESERYFDNFFKTQSLPYTLFYSTDIKQGAINYQTETASLSIDVNLHPSGVWASSVEQALEAVYKGLDATKRKSDWGLAGWPGTGVTNLKPFVAGSKTFAVSTELLNEQNKIIGMRNFTVEGNWSWKNITMEGDLRGQRGYTQRSGSNYRYAELYGEGQPVLEIFNDDMQTVTFANVKADDITDKLTLRIASINGVSAQTAAQNGVLQIRAITEKEFDNWRIFTLTKCVITGWKRDDRTNMIISGTVWGDPVKGIGESAFSELIYSSVNSPSPKLTSIIIPDSVTSIGFSPFRGCEKLASVTFQGSIPSSGFDETAFYGDLRDKFYARNKSEGTPGTYTAKENNNHELAIWTLQQ